MTSDRVGWRRWLLLDKQLACIGIVYLAGSAYMFSWFRYRINPDAVPYISIAEKYAHGNFHDALNAYWGPLLSWLLTPFALLHLNMLAAIKAITITSGLVSIVFFWLILKKNKVSRNVRLFLTILLIPIFWYWALPSPDSPDLLVVALFLAYFYLLLGCRQSKTSAFLIGLIMALGLYAKSFLAAFFIVHLFFWALVKLKAEPKGRRRILDSWI